MIFEIVILIIVILIIIGLKSVKILRPYEKGVIEKFIQGKQNFLRESPALKSYNSTIKNYTSAVKQLNDLLPEGTKEMDGEALYKFVAGR